MKILRVVLVLLHGPLCFAFLLSKASIWVRAPARPASILPRLRMTSSNDKGGIGLNNEAFGKKRLEQEAELLDSLASTASTTDATVLEKGGDAVVSALGLGDLDGGSFSGFRKAYKECGGSFTISLGIKTLYVSCDPMVLRHVLKDNALAYEKGLLREILEPILGQGPISAEFEVWKERRRVLVPGFHTQWLSRMCQTFTECSADLEEELDKASASGVTLDMEEKWNSAALDIVGRAIFNYDFNSVKTVSPVVNATLEALAEAVYRSREPLPYWKIPGLGGEWAIPSILPRQRRFQKNIKVLNDVLLRIINETMQERSEQDLDALLSKDYANVDDASLLRFLVDLRGADASERQLRDDLITLLVAGHETTGHLLTWTSWLLALYPEEKAKMVAEIDRVLGGRRPTFDDLVSLTQVRFVLAEALRLFPQPAVLIRRALVADVWPAASCLDGAVQEPVAVAPKTDLFLSTYLLHRSPLLWDRPDEFVPDRWREPTPPHLVEAYNRGRGTSPRAPAWKGYQPDPRSLYPNEASSDHAFMPFGAGPRKCLGDQFALMESVMLLSCVYQRFDFELVGKHDPLDPEGSDCGLDASATINTKNGLNMKVKRRV